MSDGKERLRAVAERVFPAGARLIAVPADEELVLLASWRLGTDEARPRKRSKTVRIAIDAEALADYAHGANGEREYADARLESLLHKRLACFDPSHDTPLGTEPPIERWAVGTYELNG